MDYDDYTGLFCNRGEFPFARRVHETVFDSVFTTSTIALMNETLPISTTSVPPSSKVSISSTLNRTNKPNVVLVVAPSHRTKISQDSRMVNHAGNDHLSRFFVILLLLFVTSVFQ